MHVRTPLALAAALLAGTLLPAASPASADTGPVPLGMTSLGRVVADEEHGHLFLSEGPRGAGVHVTDLAGARVTTVPGTAGATGMALTPDGGSLWVAQPAAGLARIDTTSLEVVQRIALPADTCAGDVAVAGDRLVYAFSCTSYPGQRQDGYDGLAVVDASDGRRLSLFTGGPFYQPRVTGGPGGHVYVSDAGFGPAPVSLYDVSGNLPRLLAPPVQSCDSRLRDLAASPDGSLVAPVCRSSEQHVLSGLSQLERVASYSTGPYPVAAAWSGDGDTFAAGTSGTAGPDVHLYSAGSTSPYRTVDFGDDRETLLPRGLAVSRDGSRVWAVTDTRGSVALRVLQDGEVSQPTPSSLTLTADRPELKEGAGTDIGGLLSSGGDAVPGARLLVDRAYDGGSASPLPSVTTRADGTFSFADVPPIAGEWTYTVAWLGDSTRAPAESTVSVLVQPIAPATVQIETSPGTAPGTVIGRIILSSSDTAQVAGRLLHLDNRVGQIPDVTTDSQGVATFVDEPGPGVHTYIAYLRSTGRAGGIEAVAVSTVTVPAVPVASTLTATAASGAVAGTPLVVGGTVTTGARPLAGALVSVVRSGCGPTGWESPSTTTAADGRWSVTDPAPDGGACTYTATYDGDDGHTGSSATAQALVALRPAALTLTVRAGTGSAKKLVHVTAQLGATRSNRTVRLTVQPTRGAETLLVEGTVDATGRLTATFRPTGQAKSDATYRVTFAGDEWYAPATAVRTP